MKIFALLFLVPLSFAGCQNFQTQQVAENKSQNENVKAEPAEPPRNFNLIKENLENAELEILSWDETDKEKPQRFEKFYVMGFPIFGNKLAKIDNVETKKQLLDALYKDMETGGAQAGCFQPHHTLKAKNKDKFIIIAICYKCGNFYGKISARSFDSRGQEFSGAIPTKEISQSLPIFNKIIAEQNIDTK